jgi:transcriptional regulator of met regulon
VSPEEATHRVLHIDAAKGDNEIAHAMEDDLLWDFVRFVAERTDEIGDTAKAVMAARDLDYDRWYA